MSLNHVQAINALREVARTAPVPWLGEIITAVSIVVTAIADAKQVHQDLQALSLRLAEVASVIVPALSSQPVIKDENLAASARTIIASIHSLGKAVEKRLSQGKVQSYFSASSNKLAIKEAEQEFELAVAGLNLCLSLSNLRISESVKPADLKTIRNQVESARREQLQLIQEEVKKKESTEAQLCKQILPVASSIFFGRDREVCHILDTLLRPEGTSVAILGPGGIGKTSLALSVMHHHHVVEHFGDRRYFVACDATNTPANVIERLASTLGLAKKRPLHDLKQFVDKGKFPILITFDNFETPWEPNENREKLEGFLSQLANIPNVSVIVTLRGAERPSGMAWSKPFLPPLTPLELESAVQAFTYISDTPEDDPYMRELILAVDLIPLAITLIATQAQFMSCQELLQRWSEEKTHMVTRGYDGRLSNLDVSIQLSLESPRFKKEPAALRLLQLLSLLPNGGTDALLSSLTENGFPLHAASAALLRVSLALRNTQGILHVLSPVREYIHSRHPVSREDLETALMYLNDLVTRFRKARFDGSHHKLVDTWASQTSNLLSILEKCLVRHSELSSESIIDTTLGLSSSLRLSGTVSLSTHEAILRKALKITSENNMEFQNALVSLPLAGFGSAHPKEYEPLIAVFKKMGDEASVFWALEQQAGEWYYGYGRIDKAHEALEEASKVDRSLIPPTSVIDFLLFKDRLLKGQPARSAELLYEAVAVSEASGDRVDKLKVYRALSTHEARRGNFPKSRFYAQAALNLCLGGQSSAQLARSLISIARTLFIQGQTEDAEMATNTAQLIFNQLGLTGDWGATVKYTLILSYISEGRQAEALESTKELERISELAPNLHLEMHLAYSTHFNNLETAGRYSEVIQRTRKEMKMVGDDRYLMFLGDLHMRQADAERAWTEYLTILIISVGTGCRLGVAMPLIRLGDLFRCCERDMQGALSCYEAATMLLRYIGAPRHLADAYIRIGLCHRFSGNADLSQWYFRKAKSLFELAYFARGSQYCEVYLEGLGDISSQTPDRDQHFLLEAVPPPTLVGCNTF